MARGRGRGCARPPRPGPRPVTQGPEVPAGGRRCRGGTSEDPSPPLLSLHRRSAELGAVTRVRGLALSSAGQETPALSLPPHQAWVSVRKGCYAFALDRRECWMGFRKCSHPTAALTSYCYLTLNWVQKGRPRAASIDGPTACQVQFSEENGPKPSKSDSAAVRCGCTVCPRQRWALARDRLKISEPRSLGAGRLEEFCSWSGGIKPRVDRTVFSARCHRCAGL